MCQCAVNSLAAGWHPWVDQELWVSARLCAHFQTNLLGDVCVVIKTDEQKICTEVQYVCKVLL